MENPQDIARENFKRWNDTLTSGNPKQVAALYAEHCLFLPTRSNMFVQDQANTQVYFEHFLKSQPEGEITEEAAVATGPDTILHVGKYTFTLQTESGPKQVPARFTFVWQRNSDGEWKILHHHSSVEPE